jgi:hypothetical protein
MSDLYDRFKDYVNYGVGIAVALSSFLLSRDRLENQLLSGSISGVLSVCVLGLSVVWMLLFMRATRDEPEMLKSEGILDRVDAKKLTRVVEGEAFVVMAVLSLGFGGLIASVTYPVTYCIIAVGIQITDCLGLAAIQRTLFEVYQDNKDLNPAIYTYYLYKPHFVLRVAKLTGFMSALSFAVAAHYSGRVIPSIISLSLIIMTIVIAELVLLIWRRWLDARRSPERN